jgi:hypothetical protein
MMEDERSSAVVGDWAGGFNLATGRQVISRALFVSTNDGLTGILDVENDVGLVLSDIVSDASRVQFDVSHGSASTLTFRGHLADNVIVGSVEQNGSFGAFDLVRSARVDTTLLEEYTGTYHLGSQRFVFVGCLLGSPQFTYYDFQTGRVGALYPTSETTFIAGHEFFVPYPTDISITFKRGCGGDVTGLTWHQNGRSDEVGARIPSHIEEVIFDNSDVQLAGTLFLPLGSGPHPAVVLIHGSGPQTRSNVRVHAEFFARRGIAALAYDKRGTGGSAGDWQLADFSDLAADAVAGVRFLQSRSDIHPTRIGLCGSSQGGWIAPLAASLAQDIAFIVLIAGSSVSVAQQNVHVAEYSLRAQGLTEQEIQEAVAHIELFNNLWRTGEGWDTLQASALAGQNTRWAAFAWSGPDRPPIEKDVEIDRDPVVVLESVHCPILALFGGQDTVVPVESNLSLMQRALAKGGTGHNVIAVFPRANHLFLVGVSDGRLARSTHFAPDYLETVADWILRRVGGTS